METRGRWLRLLVVVAVLVGAVLLAWLSVRDDGRASDPACDQDTHPRLARCFR